MTKDIIYAYERGDHTANAIGEVQSNFEMGFVIDGTKDSAKVIVISKEGDVVQPYTIVEHPNTNSWWVVSHDQVESIKTENGFIYKHTLQLLGAIELLNARDLTDCGFNAKRYTIAEVLKRLLALSNFEYAHDENLSYSFTNDNSILDMNMEVDYTKTFENYTLLSALREFFDGYNCSIKMEFVKTDGAILQAKLVIIPKTGIVGTHYNTTFSDAREIKTVDKNSYGTSVISNADNVISTNVKTFPSQGTVRLTSTQYKINMESDANVSPACIRLPSNVHKVNSIRFVAPQQVYVYVKGSSNAEEKTTITINDLTNREQLQSAILEALNYVKTKIENFDHVDLVKPLALDAVEEQETNYTDNFVNYYQDIFDTATLKIEDGFNYNPLYDKNNDPNHEQGFSADHDIPLAVDLNNDYFRLVLADKNTRDNIKQPKQCLYWERGSNLIQGFEMWYLIRYGLNTFFRVKKNAYTVMEWEEEIWNSEESRYESITIKIYVDSYDFSTSGVNPQHDEFWFDFWKTTYIVEYIPMSDLKIKYDNRGDTRNTQYYNQNGKLTDSNAFSKLLLSYSKEIYGDTITRYNCYYRYSDIPQVGEIVLVNNKPYVISNVSLKFSEHESSGYFIEGEFTLSTYVAIKSLLTNPNTNIRDYGIPQNNTVKRKQINRDFFELDYIHETPVNIKPYRPMSSIFNVSESQKTLNEHNAIIKVTYNDLVNGQKEWFYQLPCITYKMKKSIYEVVDFLDNNIIGYSSQNVWSGFDITRVLKQNEDDLVSYPISYVDSKGECADIDLCFVNNEQLIEIYNDYITSTGESTDDYGGTQNYSVFIPSEMYYGSPTITHSNTEIFYYGVVGANNPVYEQEVVGYATVLSNGNMRIIADLDSVITPLITWAYDSTKEESVSVGASITIYIGAFHFPYTQIYPARVTSYNEETRRAVIFIEGDFTNYSPNDILIRLSISAKQETIATDGAIYRNDFRITTIGYNKDALEVPVFEYCSQVDDTDNVIIGDNILDTKEDDFGYCYPVVTAIKGRINNNNGNALFNGMNFVVQVGEGQTEIQPTQPLANQYRYNAPTAYLYYRDIVNIQTHQKISQLRIKLYNGAWLRQNNGTITRGSAFSKQDILDYVGTTNDLVIGRYSLNLNNYMSNDLGERDMQHDMLMVLKNIDEDCVIEENGEGIIVLYINNYKD